MASIYRDHPQLAEFADHSSEYRDLQDAQRIFMLTQKLYPKNGSPLVWAEAQEGIYQVNSIHKSFSKGSPEKLTMLLAPLFEIYTQEAFPHKWADAQLRLAKNLSELGESRMVEAKNA